MSREEFRIPRIQLPQIGSAAPPNPTPEQEGSVRKAEDHHDRFRRFLDSGEGLDNLVASVERDTVGSDGRTADQRESDALTAHHESVIRQSAVEAPRAPANPRSFFDDDDTSVSAPEEHGSTGPLAQGPPPPLTSQGTLPAVPPQAQPPVVGDDIPPEPPPDTGDRRATDHDHLREDPDDHPSPDPDPDGAVPPPGSLWDSTHGSAGEVYEPGPVVVDPTPERAEPGALAQWARHHYQRRWIPLPMAQKVGAIGVVVALALWGGFLMFGASDTAPQPVAADPIVDAPAPPAGPSAAPLPPDTVTASGCPARSQPPANAFDGKPETAWVCVRAYNTDLQTITLTYSKPVVVCSIFVIPGFEHTDNNGRNEWNEHRVVTRIIWRLGGQPFPQDLDPAAHTGATVQIPCVATQVITGKIFQTVPPPPTQEDNGPSDEDINSTFAISTITVNGYPAGGVPR